MTPADVADYRQRLLALRKRLDRDRLQLEQEALQPAGDEAIGSLSDVPFHLEEPGSHALEEELTLSLLENTAETVREINSALSRMDQEVYGRCESCRQPIAGRRLQALPYARHCLACARRLQEKVA